MLLLVVALLLIVSRKTKLFEGMENIDIPGLDEIIGNGENGGNGADETPEPIHTTGKGSHQSSAYP